MALRVDSEKDLPAAVRRQIEQAGGRPARSRRPGKKAKPAQWRGVSTEPGDEPSTSHWACMVPGCRKISKSWAEAEGHSDAEHGASRIAIVL